MVPLSGLELFEHVSGGRQKEYIFEATSGGVCVLDYDNDDLMDVYLVNGGDRDILAGLRSPVSSRLFRNAGQGHFTDATETASVSNTGAWGHGCAAADFDADGWVDLYVTSYGPNRLYKNGGDGTFSEIAVEAGVSDPRWSTGAAWADFDRDGALDLFVANYIELNPEHLPLSAIAGGPVESRFCEFLGKPVFCGPRGLLGAPDVLYRNNGDGTFRDVTRESGLEERVPAFGFGVAWADFDRDGFLDLFVANDTTPNYLYRNKGAGGFEELAYLAGVALSEEGREQAGMGVAVEDYDGDDLPDIFITHFSHDTNTLYRNLGENLFADVSYPSGLGESSLPFLGWGTFFFDFDNDGDRDLFVANGHVYPQVDEWSSGTHYAQRSQLFENVGNKFSDITAKSGNALQERRTSRGAAYFDYDNDGRLDIVINNLDDRPTLLRNTVDNTNHYLQLRVITGKRDAVGAHISLRAAGIWQYGEVRAGGSYLSQNDPRLHFGLGTAGFVDELRVRWPDGISTTWRGIRADQLLTVEEDVATGSRGSVLPWKKDNSNSSLTP